MAQMKAQVDKLLTNVSSMLVPDGFIADAILPAIGVSQDTGKLGKYGNNHLRIQHTLMGGRGQARRVELITRSSDSYSLEYHGLEGIVTESDLRNVEAPFDAEKDETMALTTVLQLGKEKALADALSSTAILTQNTTLAGNAQFSDFTNSDPITKIRDARMGIFTGCGSLPNAAIMGVNVAETLRYHPKILSTLGFANNRAGQLTNEELAKALGVSKVFIGAAVHNSATEGQSDALTALWGKVLVLAVLPDRPLPYQTSLGYRFYPNGKNGPQTYKYPLNNPPNSEAILVQDQYDHVLTNVKAGYLIKDVIA